MQISEINNKDELSALIINELKDIGVKYRKDKKSKVFQDKTCRKRIFRTHLHLLELTDVILTNGGVVQIPKFVADACNRILEQVETEGIFRKAGSSLRQKEIRLNLEAGLSLGKSHHVVDVANLVKSFFRELPEPLIPSSLQETLLRSLLIGQNHIKAILLTCLLLPPLTINTLAFFMQFLYTVSQSSHLNKMSIENLAIIFTPGIMPFSDITSHRFNNHVKMVQLLIENAYSIGTIPDCIIDKLEIHEVISNTPSKSRSYEALEIVTQKKKKKRRSGSLTQMFNGLRKIVGSAIGSSENLENTPEHKVPNSNALASDQEQQQQNSVHTAATPCLKSTKKRKFAEPVCAFSAKKKKDLLALLPNNSGGFLPNTPLTKEPKKSRLSLAGRKHIKNISNNPVVTSMERRWSIVGYGWSKSKKSLIDTKKDTTVDTKSSPSETPTVKHHNSVISMPCFSKIDFPTIDHPVVENLSSMDSASCTDCSEICTELSDNDYVRIPKNEYQAIQERVAAIETRISQEFGSIRKTLKRTSFPLTDEVDGCLSGPERVENKYKQVITDTESFTSPTTEQLALRLSRGLKIRRNSENRVMRSPSARKIGTIRRRSQEKVRLSRNQTWHISSTANTLPLNKCEIPPAMPANCFYSKRNLKRGRPNTLATGLYQQQCTPTNDAKYNLDENISNENWTDGENFFSVLPPKDVIGNQGSTIKTQQFNDAISTPVKQTCINVDNIKTPMLPPKSVPRKMNSTKTPSSSTKMASATKNDTKHRALVSTPINEEANGRASIARLRAQNAGMVMAKAKLFDGLGRSHCFENENDSSLFQANNVIHQSSSFGVSSSNDLKKKNSLKSDRITFITTHETPLLNSPGLSEKEDLTCKSPFYAQKRKKPIVATRFPNKNLLNTVLSDKNLTQPRKGCDSLDIRNINHNKQRNITQSSTSTSYKQLSVNSPRRARTNRLNNSRTHTPLKSIQRNSPRQVKFKSNSRKAT